jgi:hypothetical protein
MHVLGYAAQIVAMIVLLGFNTWFLFACVFLAFFLSGMVCAHASWHCHLPEVPGTSLPLKERPWYQSILMIIPYGWGQGIIIMQAINDFRLQSRLRAVPNSHAEEAAPMSRYHCKAINGMIEGLLCTSVFGMPRKLLITRTMKIQSLPGMSTISISARCWRGLASFPL